ncbi:phospholipase A [Pigmentiphaga soli]|uniref:phospholipase A n=1 Tax=Pigmentiphaga soli TaxID=1007095 RepID=UPI0031ED2702
MFRSTGVGRRAARLRVLAAALSGLALGLGAAAPARAAATFRLDRLQAAPGETVRIEAMFFNDGNASTVWTPPRELILQWRDAKGAALRSRAVLDGDGAALDVPVGRFSRVTWRAVVPMQVHGLQAIGIEGEPVLLALDATAAEAGAVAGTRAYGPILDDAAPGTAPAVPDTGVLSSVSGAGAASAPASSALVGPAPNEAASASYENDTLQRFRSAVSSFEPVYFSVGTRDGNARFQISLKYRFFQPEAGRPRLRDNIYLGYTQTSLWDIGEESAPFRDSSYRPSLFWMSENVWESASRRWSMGFDGGLEHESNGKDGDASRAVNSVYGRPALRYRFGDGSTLSFAPKIKGYLSTNGNPDLSDYRGHVDYLLRWASDDGPMVSALIRRGHAKGSLQLDLAYPLRSEWLANLNGFLHLQYFTGYGDTLLDYNVRARPQLRIGLMIIR